MISETISHYRILSKLGAGGMGEVYLAEDMRLGRQVALKFLPASYQYDPDRKAQFLKDTRIASGLRSPNIAAIYDIGEHQETTFIVREYVEGEMISRRVERGPMPVREAIDIGVQVADALDEVHRMGFVHCNIKSSNLIITERGLVKILDFGLLRADGSDPSDLGHDRTAALNQQTSLSVVSGNVSYLSPEQTLGHDIDHRSDIFSLGVVLYEMLTGRLPFEAESPSAIIDLILHHEPPMIGRLNYSVPPELERIVRKCLEKDRSRRYQSAQEIAIDLRSLQRDSATDTLPSVDTNPRPRPTRRLRSRKTIDSLAILPLINESNDPDTEYLTDGIT
ncbi:MAG TPA: serine/threonine-protein kinase, partial [Blastocatellia bacterium]|nr:serine/threonine-protein kinase [Blastocatellia bacterium]